MARAIFITGASAGIGEVLALEFARRGDQVAIAARRVDKLEALAARLTAAGAAAVLPIELDVADTASVGPAVEHVAREFGRLDIVVANAGVGVLTPVGKGRLETVRQTFDVNLLGAIATIEAAVTIMRGQRSGQVVGITSMAGWRGLPGFGAYSASKAGLHRYLQSLRTEVAHDGIAVTELSPGFIDTDMNRSLGQRPFLIDVQKGGALMAGMIERRVGYRTVPVWPWSLIGPLLKILPASLFVPRARPGRGADRPKS